MSRAAAAVAFLTAAGLLLRLLGALDPLWLDEVWSLERATGVASFADVFTAIHSDNNHWLVSLWLRWAGPEATPLVLRAPAIVLGTLAVPAAFLAGRARAGAAAGVVAAAVVAVSYPFVHYGSEARGYAPATFFLLLSAWQAERDAARPRAASALGLAFAATAALLCHLTALFGVAALAVRAGALPVATDATSTPRVRRLAPFAVPLGALAALFALDLRHWEVAGGDDVPAWRGFVDAAAWLLGAPAGGTAAFLAAALLVVATLLCSRRATDGTALALPLLAATLSGARFVPPRYFLVPLVLPVLAVAEAAAAGVRRGGVLRALVLCGALVFTIHQAFFLREFLEHGRGATPELVRVLARTAREEGRTVTVGLDFAPRLEPVLRHHARRIAGGDELRLVPERAEPAPDFLVHHVFAGGPDVGATLAGPHGRSYVLVRRDEHFGLSGWTWLLYRLS